jgi:hypothetical protein
MLPADGTRTVLPPEPPLALPPAVPGADAAIERSIAAVVRDYCLAALEEPALEAKAAERIGAVGAANPWFGRPFREDAPAQAWTLPDASRSFFWLERGERPNMFHCWVKAFDGRRSAMAPIALGAIEDYARAEGFGATLYPGSPLSMLERRGSIGRIYAPRNFNADLSWDRSNYPRLEGFVVVVSAAPKSNN